LTVKYLFEPPTSDADEISEMGRFRNPPNL